MGISLAGATAATHEKFRQGCDFARIDKTLRTIKKMKRKLQMREPSVHLLLHSNWRELGRLPALAAEWGASQVVINNLSFIDTTAMQDESLLLQAEL